ncbi:MAG: TatD family hydrolase [Chthoniobacterales bacterium]
MWIDAHNHLQAPLLAETLPILTSLPMEAAVVNGTTEADWPHVQELAAEYPWIRPAFGLHPWFLARRTANWKKALDQFLSTPQSSLGEIGLDLWMKDPDRAAQEEIFRWQLTLAAERNIPATIHCLKAFGLLTKILRTNPLPACGFLLHAWSGSIEIARECLDMGAYFSFSGHFLHERKAARREVFRQLPLERLLVETDAPSMNLPDHLAKATLESGANHPANIVACYEHLARIRGMEVADLALAVRNNFHRLFQ